MSRPEPAAAWVPPYTFWQFFGITMAAVAILGVPLSIVALALNWIWGARWCR